MLKPTTFKELFKLVNPRDLLKVIDFSGIKDQRYDEYHDKKRRELQNNVDQSIYFRSFLGKEPDFHENEPKLLNVNMEDIHYKIIVDSIQSFYRWSHQFNHVHAHIYQRVMNALEIPLEDISVIMEMI